jgi:type I restriction-modification system DNA methylase subunit
MTRWLSSIYEVLDFKGGSLFTAMEEPTTSINSNDWLEKGEWLAAARRAGAEKIFFVDNNPVVVFAECGSDHIEKARTFNRIWSLARPRLLFLASPDEISVIDLAQKPLNLDKIRGGQSFLEHELEILKTIKNISEITQQLQNFHRDNIESGNIFNGDHRFGDLKNRADKSLMRDLKTVRRELIQAGLSKNLVKYAHALIGRSIFIRYLEDREILTLDYFQSIARQTTVWMELLKTSSTHTDLDFSGSKALYPRILKNKDFTYALFRRLAKDFNGDMFPEVELYNEETIIKQKHLNLIQDLLYGDVGIQKKLFFYSYMFDIIPLDLISSIYEEFYHPSTDSKEKMSKARQDGAYYTPPVLVEFLLSQTLTIKELKNKPRVLDPACGSGIFLVEAFRRMVRYEWQKLKIRPSFERLKQILQDQIAGIEINEEAARITAFSLYLAMLHYLEPPSIKAQIKQGNKLPNILVKDGKSPNNIHCIWVGNAFDQNKIESIPILKKRFGEDSIDIVVGNPPWGAPGNKAEREVKDRERVMLEWCHTNNRQLGDKEPSQAFLWRALSFLKKGGRTGMLVSAGVLFKHGKTTQIFRDQWMHNVRLSEVFNFSHVRSIFFKGSIAPFLALVFSKNNQNDHTVKYYSAKQIINIKETQSIILSKYDVHTLLNEDLTSGELWKNLWFGRFADRKFLKQFDSNVRLFNFVNRNISGQGYKIASKEKNADNLKELSAVDINSFTRYGKLSFIPPPTNVHRFGVMDVYFGKRLLVQRGISERQTIQGLLNARYEKDNFCFTNAINGIKLNEQDEWRYKVLLGILWSSFARYYFFMTSSNWGLWHHEIHLEDELLNLPVKFMKNNPATNKIIKIVEKLRNFNIENYNLFNPNSLSTDEFELQQRKWEEELDTYVFELYDFNDEQKDLIKDCCEITIPFFYKPFDSNGIKPVVQANDFSWIKFYVQIFAQRWNAYLDDNLEMRSEIHVGAHGNMVAIEFYPADKSDQWNLNTQSTSWAQLLDQIDNTLLQTIGISQILIDGVIHFVSDHSIIIIKRNEKRLWSRSLAREDAEATLCKRMTAFKPNKKAGN